MLCLRDLSVELSSRSRTIHPLNGISFVLARGQTLGIVGESGSGKSMLAQAILRLLPTPFRVATSGSIQLDGQNLLSLSENEMRAVRGAKISMIFQEPLTALDPTFTIGEQIVETIRTHSAVARSEARAIALSLLGQVGIPSPSNRFDAYPFELSGGLRQRVVIAISLALKPKVLIADEPTTALDVTVQAQIMKLLSDLQRDLGMGMILITHDLGVVSQAADRIAVMYGGTFVEVAPPAALFNKTIHPYTAGLIRSKTGGISDGGLLYAIPGLPPVLTEPLRQCPFAGRCERTIPECRASLPKLVPHATDPDHKFACWNPLQ